jgi:plasmid stabilization system protein ParE
MAWRIKYTARAWRDLNAAFRWIAGESPDHAARWRQGLLKAVERLEEFPRSGKVAPESAAFRVDVRCLLYGRKHGVYKIFYTISGKTIAILHLRHGARKELEP